MYTNLLKVRKSASIVPIVEWSIYIAGKASAQQRVY